MTQKRPVNGGAGAAGSALLVNLWNTLVFGGSESTREKTVTVTCGSTWQNFLE